MEKAKSQGAEFIIMGDLNVTSPQWGSPVADPRGEYLTEWLAELDMTVINKGDKPVADPRGEYLAEWLAELDMTVINKGDKPTFKKNVLEIEPNTVSLEGFEKIVKGAYRGACFSKEVKSRLQPYWWNEDIDDKKGRESTVSRRKHKKELQKLIRDSKRAHWNGLCEELEKDMWGRGYQIAVKKLIGYASFDLEPNQKKDIIRSLFPERRLARTERALDMEVKWFKQEELERAAQSLRGIWELKSQVGKEMQSVTNMINLMVEHSGIWEEVHRHIRDVMSKKEKKTRQRN
ncbi:Endonuclease-reverse transcriptase [Popillia japonica]|uniref:Endonuclease-reverse transcriptase n=1 Tax=Popillia japonica TaxID=7064 RepID=A0AAW1LN75_POPJA